MKLPVVSGTRMIKLLSKQGFQTVRQKGDHITLYKQVGNDPYLVVVPLKKEIKKGTLLSILRQARIGREEFERLLEEL